MLLVSIIVPVYMVEEYLPRCVESLRNQTYSNLEIILVDDGSYDRCSVLCDDYAALDNRIKVIHKNNGGLSDARNAGIEIASGECIAFVDSDDWVTPDFVEKLMHVMESENADIVECESIVTDRSDITDEGKNAFPSIQGHYSAEDALYELINDHVFHQVVWNKIYSKKIIGDIRFAKGKCNEDEFFTYQVFGRADRIVKIGDPLYFYYQRQNSIMGASYNIKRLDAIEAKCYRHDYICRNYPKLEAVSGTNLIGSIVFAGQMCLLHMTKGEQGIALEKLKRWRNQYFYPCKYFFVGKAKYVIWYYMALINLSFTCRLRNALKINIH